MKIFDGINDIRKEIEIWKKAGLKIGLVPTMGYLHAGHASLIKESVKNNDKTVVSVFVNPSQFAPNEDLESYPRDLERDSEIVKSAGGDAVFCPCAEEMYGKNHLTSVKVSDLSEKLCGITRPSHFAGVTTVVAKLFNIVLPDKAYFGLKDYQQYIIIKKMAEDLNFNIDIQGVPIVRDSDGLALSSRNIYLSEDERKAALSLSRSLIYAEKNIKSGVKAVEIIGNIRDIVEREAHTKIDYIKICDPLTLRDLDIISSGYAVLLAVYVGKARLIDNLVKFNL